MNQPDASLIEPPTESTSVRGGEFWRRTDLWRGWLLFVVMLVFLSLLAASLFFWPQLPAPGGEDFFLSFPFQAVLAVSLLATLLLLGYLLARDLLVPAHHVRNWLMKVHAGDLSARLFVAKGNGVFSKMEGDLNTMVEMLESQSNNASEQLSIHMEHVAEKTRFLAMLYNFATEINTRRGLNDLLSTMLWTLEDVLGIDRVVIRKNFGGGQMMRLATRGVFIKDENRLLLSMDSPYLQDDEQQSRLVLQMLTHGVLIGVCSLYLKEKLFARRKELAGLFSSVVRHFGMAIEACRLDEESNRLLILEERARIGREVHDSLAQTISSLRFQVCTMHRHVEKSEHEVLPEELGRLDATVKTANLEVRELIEHFRAPPLAQKTMGLTRSLGDMLERFRYENPGIRFFFHSAGDATEPPEEHVTEVQMICQEALNNVVRHAAAKNVRVFIGQPSGDQRVVLVEDDGVGMPGASTSVDGSVRGHYGMSMMGERARAIGARLDIDSEPGEGVCVRLEYTVSEGGAPGLEKPFAGVSTVRRVQINEDKLH